MKEQNCCKKYDIKRKAIMKFIFLLIMFLETININCFSQDAKSLKCTLINEFVDNIGMAYLVDNHFTENVSCLKSHIIDKADVDTTIYRFILEIHKMNIRRRTAKLVAGNFSPNRLSTVYLTAFFEKKKNEWRLKSISMDFVKR